MKKKSLFSGYFNKIVGVGEEIAASVSTFHLCIKETWDTSCVGMKMSEYHFYETELLPTVLARCLVSFLNQVQILTKSKRHI